MNDREISGRTQCAREFMNSIPIKGTHKEPLFLKLLNCDLSNIEMGDLLELVHCLKSAKAEDSRDTYGNDNNLFVTCPKCYERH